MSKNDQIRRLIEAIVRKELKEIVPQVVKEVMAGMIMEATVSPEATQFRGNSDKRIRMTESTRTYLDDTDYEDAPVARPSRPRPAVEWDGGDGPALQMEGYAGLNVPTKAATESGNLVNINPAAVPDFIIKAMNTNYSGFMQSVSAKTRRHG